MTRMASVPRWVLQHSPAAVKMYALLDLEDGNLTIEQAAFFSDLSKSTVVKALKELRDSGAIRRTRNAHYEIRRENPLSTESTELCTGRSTGDTAAGAASAQASDELFTDSTGPTTTTRRQGEETPGVNTAEVEVQKAVVPKLVLVDVPGVERKQNLGFNAIAEECDADPRSRTGEITTALKQIRKFVWEELRDMPPPRYSEIGFEHALANDIRRHAQLYRSRMRGATLTPTALAKWWFDLEKLPERGLTPDEIASGSWRDS